MKGISAELTYLAVLTLLVSGLAIVSEFSPTGMAVGTGDQATNTGSVRVFVRDRATTELLYNAFVRVYDAKGVAVKSGDTKGGNAAFSGLKAGVYSAWASATVYKPGKGTFSVVAGTESMAAIFVEKTASTPSPSPPATGSAEITVTDRGTNAALKNAKVSVYDAGNNFLRTVATGSGSAKFALPDGRYTASATAPGYKTYSTGFRVMAGQNTNFGMSLEPLTPSSTASKGTSSPAPAGQQPATGSARISIRDKTTGNMLTGVWVNVRISGPTGRTASTENGVAVFETLKPGTYTAYADVTGYGRSAGVQFTVESGGEARATIELEKSIGSARITVTDSESRAVSGAEVSVERGGETKTAATVSGVAVFGQLVPGTYTAAVGASGYRDARRQFTVSTGSETPVTIILQKAATPTGTASASPTATGQTSSTGSVRITVTDRGTGIALRNVRVSIFDEDARYITSGGTGNGFAVFYLQPGSYIASATADGYRRSSADFSIAAGAERQAAISLKKISGGSPSPTANPSPTQPTTTPPVADKIVRITVKDAESNSIITNAKVFVYNIRGRLGASGDTAAGVATFSDLQDGLYRASASAPGYKAGVTAFRVAQGSGEAAIALEKTAPTGTAPPSSRPGLTGSARITVADSKTDEPLNAEIDMYDARGQAVQRKRTESGAAVFTELEAGAYYAWARASGYMTGKERVSVKAGEESLAAMKLGKTISGGTVKVSVIDNATKMPLNAEVEMQNAKGQFVESKKTANGLAVFTGLRPGVYRAWASAAGYVSDNQIFRMSAEAESVVTIGLGKAASNEGSARFSVADNSTRQPVGNAKVYVYDSRGQFVASGQSSAAGNGIVVFSGLKAGVYSAWTAATGYRDTRTAAFRVTAGTETTVSVFLGK